MCFLFSFFFLLLFLHIFDSSIRFRTIDFYFSLFLLIGTRMENGVKFDSHLEEQKGIILLETIVLIWLFLFLLLFCIYTTPDQISKKNTKNPTNKKTTHDLLVAATTASRFDCCKWTENTVFTSCCTFVQYKWNEFAVYCKRMCSCVCVCMYGQLAECIRSVYKVTVEDRSLHKRDRKVAT